MIHLYLSVGSFSGEMFYHEIHSREWENLRLAGEGLFCNVFRGKCRGKEVAIRILCKQDYNEKVIQGLKEEVVKMRYFAFTISLSIYRHVL